MYLPQELPGPPESFNIWTFIPLVVNELFEMKCPKGHSFRITGIHCHNAELDRKVDRGRTVIRFKAYATLGAQSDAGHQMWLDGYCFISLKQRSWAIDRVEICCDNDDESDIYVIERKQQSVMHTTPLLKMHLVPK